MTPEQIRQTLASARIPYHFPGRNQTEAIHGDCVDALVPVVSRLIEEATVTLRNEVDRMRDDGACDDCEALTDRVAAERDAALAEVERLRELAEHPQGGSALGIAWPIDRLAPDGISWHDHFKAEVERRGAAEAAVARVEALLLEPFTADDVRAALRGDAT